MKGQLQPVQWVKLIGETNSVIGIMGILVTRMEWIQWAKGAKIYM